MEAAELLAALVRQRIESRYRRIRFVHLELAKLDTAAPIPDPALISRESFEDFVFSRIDFSIYKKIDTEEFRLLFDEGLNDYSEDFYQNAFKISREEVRRIIGGVYIRVGPFYVCKRTSPLLLSIMRTLHTSLEFVPLIGNADLAGILPAGKKPEQIRAVAEALDGLVIRHDDGMETKLFVPKEQTTCAAQDGAAQDGAQYSNAVLRAIFHPLGKAYTVTLIP
ncbi:hypothetical protein AGMMS50230_11100 [Spirochaetia bacterium]|nr:hypothetical protein AGMMS50230_11100 [Spirochaetia bacterium]